MSQKLKSSSLIVCAFVFSFLILAMPASSKSKDLDLGGSVNYWLPGTIDIEGYDYDKDPGFLFRGFIDSYVVEKLAVGGYLNWAPSVEVETSSGSMYELGAALKYRAIFSKMFLKIGVEIGYRKMESDITDDDIEGLGVNGIAELQFDINQQFMPFAEIGFLSQPAGGNDYADVTWAPILYIGGGIVF